MPALVFAVPVIVLALAVVVILMIQGQKSAPSAPNSPPTSPVRVVEYRAPRKGFSVPPALTGILTMIIFALIIALLIVWIINSLDDLANPHNTVIRTVPEYVPVSLGPMRPTHTLLPRTEEDRQDESVTIYPDRVTWVKIAHPADWRAYRVEGEPDCVLFIDKESGRYTEAGGPHYSPLGLVSILGMRSRNHPLVMRVRSPAN